ncbi:MAG: hypothetical protein J0M02_06460 [Planctomycetes bacterium]|nr:hypothetical protein [Planctomycetota bacterium]
MSGDDGKQRTLGDRISTAIFWLVLGSLGLALGLVLLINGLDRGPAWLGMAGGAVLVLTILGLRQGWRSIRR